MVQGVGGIIELAPGYLRGAYDIIKKAGGLCIADEVQAGFARTGSHFWGFEAHGVVPDIVTMAKVCYVFMIQMSSQIRASSLSGFTDLGIFCSVLFKIWKLMFENLKIKVNVGFWD